MPMSYKLSANLAAHTLDVRAVCSPTDNLVLSASRDTTAISWRRPSPSVPFEKQGVLRAGSRFVNTVTYIPPSPDAPEGYAVTGGQDTIVNVFSLASASDEPDFSLLGHTQNVCALHATSDGTIISGSWDQTARVWKKFAPAYELIGHQQSVWAVLAIDPDQFLTGSADNTIKLWKTHKTVKTYTGHTQAVRGLALIPDIGFASCSNDSEIRIWTLEGDVVYTLSGHTSFVYSLSVLASGDIVSGGEDRTVRIWRDGECAQTIVHPAISVWAVSTMPNGDIVTGCSDGVVRVFSASEDRWAPAEEIKAYEDQVASTSLPSQQVGDVKKSDLPGVEALSQPGKKAGEVKMIRNGDSAEAYQWNSPSGQWQKIGQVVDAVGAGRRQLYQGKEYDYVFDVDVQEGVPPLKLPYNASENPYSAATKFLESNDLPLSYLDEVVKFIEKNTAGVQLGGGTAEYSDPFTGASRYRAAPSNSSGGGSDFMDPFTGASRYRAPVAPAPAPVAASSDPWTGASRYSGGPSAPSSPPPSQPLPMQPMALPVKTPLTWRQANVSAMQGKLYQFDEVLRNEISTSSLSMYNQELNLIDETFVYLSQAVAKPDEASHSPPPGADHIDAIMALLERWPTSQRFPVIDLARLVTGFSPDSYANPDVRRRFFDALFQGAEWHEKWTMPIPKMRETNMLLLLRALANAFQEHATVGDGAWVQQIFDKLGEAPYMVFSKQPRIALATIPFNFSCLCLREPVDANLRTTHLALILEILSTERTESEAAYRALVALGNVVYVASTTSNPLSSVQVEQAKQALANLPTAFKEDRIRAMASTVRSML